MFCRARAAVRGLAPCTGARTLSSKSDLPPDFDEEKYDGENRKFQSKVSKVAG
jgi:hypothetical protein